MLTLPIKKKWFDMILSGEKKEEYREIKPYYISRFMSYRDGFPTGYEVQKIMFRNGYSKTSPSFIAKCTLSVGTGKEEWGAEKDKQYFVLTIHEILDESDMETIYTYLGNACNHEKMVRFIESGYDMRMLKESETEE